MALIVAGDRSGVGKTTVTLAILAYLADRSKRVQSFKVGPDFIDPMFHRAVTGLPCRNLDPVLTSPDYVRACFNRYTKEAEWVVVEGVMGLFDGVGNPNESTLNDYGSTAHVARILDLPILLVLDCSRLSTSIAAIAHGYSSLNPKVTIAGIVLNRVASDRHLELLATALNNIGLPILGVLRRNASVAIPDRHLGLVPEIELPQIDRIFNELAYLAKISFNWDKLAPLLSQKPTANSQQDREDITLIANSKQSTIRLAVARDKAFNFYYQDNLDLLSDFGAELVYWSPLRDSKLPEDIDGLYFGGGFPEMFARQLTANKRILQQLRQLIQAGMPTYAECGGLMYLCRQLIDLDGQSWTMVGAIPSTVTMQAKLTLGYRRAIALRTSSLIEAGQTVMGHEFHRSQPIATAVRPQWQLQGVHRASIPCSEGWNIHQLHASYLHIHWGAAKFLPQQLIQSCRNYQTSL